MSDFQTEARGVWMCIVVQRSADMHAESPQAGIFKHRGCVAAAYVRFDHAFNAGLPAASKSKMTKK
jgi:hypothetical protein